jgi:hypothetical protein
MPPILSSFELGTYPWNVKLSKRKRPAVVDCGVVDLNRPLGYEVGRWVTYRSTSELGSRLRGQLAGEPLASLAHCQFENLSKPLMK